MTSPTYYVNGEWNFYCDLCGKKEKSGRAMRTWDGFYVCSRHAEIRNPQDFVRGVADNQTTPWSRPEPGDIFPYEAYILLEAEVVLLQEDGFELFQETGFQLLQTDIGLIDDTPGAIQWLLQENGFPLMQDPYPTAL